VTFTSSIGNLNELTVQAYNYVTKGTGLYGASSVSSDDTVSVVTTVNGSKDAIKAALELLPNVGTVTVSQSAYSPTGQICSWEISFDTNAGDLELLKMSIYDTAQGGIAASAVGSVTTFNTITGTVTETKKGTSVVIGGNFALEFDGARTIYLPYNCTARTMKFALESLDTIGQVDVSRSSVDENNGYTWSVTFLTELGDVSPILFDNYDMTGTAVSVES